MMFPCPNCGGGLQTVRSEHGMYWLCPVCGGRAVTLVVLRRLVPPGLVAAVWGRVLEGQGTAGRPCPSCQHPMHELPVGDAVHALRLDFCTLCHFVWFDPREFQELPSSPRVAVMPAEAGLPPAARELLALEEVKAITERARREEGMGGAPDSWWQYVPALLGLPVEHEVSALARRPWVTWGLAAVVSLVSLLAFADLESVVQALGFIPAQAWRYGGLTMLTTFFLHGDLFHLLGNMYFLLVFGDNVEDFVGRARFALLLLAATLLGVAFHGLAEVQSDLPLIGASGGISGVLMFYALKFPHARLGFLFWFHWIRMPVLVALALWVLLQVVGAFQQVAGQTNVSALGHLGGAAVGFVFWLAWRDWGAAPVSRTTSGRPAA